MHWIKRITIHGKLESVRFFCGLAEKELLNKAKQTNI